MPDYLQAAERIARRVVPELSGHELLLVQPSAEVSEIMSEHGTIGFYARDYQRPGAVTINCAFGLIDYEAAFVGMVLHELMHWIIESHHDPRPAVAPSPAPALHPPTHTVAANFQATTADIFPVAYFAHGPEFTRLACHAWFRSAISAAYALPINALVFASAYPGLEAMSHPGAYIEALYTDALEHRHERLTDILGTPAPAEFMDLHKADFRRLCEAVVSAHAKAA